MHDAPVPLVELPLAGAFNAMDSRRRTTVLITGVQEEKRSRPTYPHQQLLDLGRIYRGSRRW
jgi:hypothetical protein